MPPVRSRRFATQVRACSHSECRLLLRHLARCFDRDFIDMVLLSLQTVERQGRCNAVHGPVIGFEYFEVAGFVALAEMAVSARLNAVAGDRQRHQVYGIIGILTAVHGDVPGRDDMIDGAREAQRLCFSGKPYAVGVEFSAAVFADRIETLTPSLGPELPIRFFTGPFAE